MHPAHPAEAAAGSQPGDRRLAHAPEPAGAQRRGMGSSGKDRARETLQVEPCRVGTGGLQPDGGEGKDALFRPVPGLGEEQEETPRNAVGWSMERESQFLECFYSKEPREEMGSRGKT